MKRQISYTVDNSIITVEIEGETVAGPPQVLLNQEDDLTAAASWHESGYVVAPFLTQDENGELRSGLCEILHGLVDTITRRHTSRFNPENYHNYIGNDENHIALTREIKNGFAMRFLPIDIEKVEKRLSDLCRVSVESFRTASDKSRFNLRVVRPHKNDNNPPHRDVWLDHLKNSINVYFPIAGGGPDSDLPLVPGSHLWRESDIERTSEGAKVNGLKFTVPSVTSCKDGIQMVRPRLGPEDFLLFSPYLIHGGGRNLSENKTRFSLEMRFWRALRA